MSFFLLLILPLFMPASALHGLKHTLSKHNRGTYDGKNFLSPPLSISSCTSSEEAHEKSRISWENWDGPDQFSGFLTFSGSRSDGSSPKVNTFFWLFPSLDRNPNAPLLLWLQGGPGGSSLYGAFEEIGSFGINATGSIFPRDPKYNWNQHYNLLFLDNPCGVGFSFSSDESCFVTNEKEVGSDLYNAMQEFFNGFPEFRNNDLYVTGESYAGKYVPALSYTILKENEEVADEFRINLKGLSIGDGAMDPPTQFSDFGNLLFYSGMVNHNERKVFQGYENDIQRALRENDLIGAFESFDEMLNGDFISPTYYQNVTGLTNYFNFEQGDCGSCKPEYYADWLVSPHTREKIHVGDLAFDSFNETVEIHLKEDWMRGVTDMLVPLLENIDIKVLIYSGQNDIILGAPLTENFLKGLQWEGQGTFNAREKVVWTIDGEAAKLNPVAGYITNVDKYNVAYAVVRGAGHMVPLDQPQRAYDLITRFVEGTIPTPEKV